MLHELFDKQTPVRKVAATSPDAGKGLVDDFGSFGLLTSERDRAVMLEIRQKDGMITAHSYSWLESAEFNPSEGISLNFSGKTVKLIGRNLNAESRPNVRLFEGLLCHRVPWIQEADDLRISESLETDVVIDEVKTS